MAVATNGALKAVDHDWGNAAGQELTFCNTYHLLLQPGGLCMCICVCGFAYFGGVVLWMHGSREPPFFDGREARTLTQAPYNIPPVELITHAGPEVIKECGGLHKFINRNRPIITDSGGFQVRASAGRMDTDVYRPPQHPHQTAFTPPTTLSLSFTTPTPRSSPSRTAPSSTSST